MFALPSLTNGCAMTVNRRLDEWVSEERLRELVMDEIEKEEEFDPEMVPHQPDHCTTRVACTDPRCASMAAWTQADSKPEA